MANPTVAYTRDDLLEDYKRAHRTMECAAFSLAYDVSIRAADPTGVKTGHAPANLRMTEFLKAEFVAAHNAERAAYQCWCDSTLK
jgi:hypothetical protein